jgi:tetratricopeptide (TPR) repeat protein/S1-C subfamily serine protease
LTPGETIHSAGFPFGGGNLKTNMGKVDIQMNKPLQGGYQIGFNVATEPGMSGGSLLNSKGQLIGIIGFSSYPILNDGYQYQEGSQLAASEIKELRKSSFAIPIATLAIIDRQYAALLPKNGGAVATTSARTKYTGVVKKVDDIAQQITVRIERKDGGNGSGVIVAREGDTYYVATAAHVVQDIFKNNGRNVLRDKMAKAIVTPTGEQITLSDGAINITNPDLDVAVVKFKSTHKYDVAQVGKYDFNRKDWVFVSGFPRGDSGKRRFTIGKLQNRAETEFRVKDRASLTRGYNLIYTNLSLGGMSGGAVLDRQGRLIGLNTGAENEVATEEINFGYALGIPISTVLGVTNIPMAQGQVTDVPVSKSSQKEDEEIKQIQSSTLAKPEPTASSKEWLDYANLLWRGDQDREAVDAFYIALKLLNHNLEIPNRREQVRIASFGTGLVEIDRNPKVAIVAFQLAVKTDPNFYQSWRYLGSSLSNMKRYDEALSAYQQAIKLNRDNFILYKELGDVFRKMNRYSDAINAYTTASDYQPNHPWAYNNRGNCYGQLKQYDNAILDYNRAIKINSQDKLSYYNRGRIYIDRNQYPQAITDFDRTIILDSQYASAYNNLGLAYKNQGHDLQAMADFNRTIELDPQSVEAYNNRGNLYHDRHQYTQAIADFDRAIKLDPQYVFAYNNRGLVYKEQKYYSQAIADYTQALQLDSQYLLAYKNRGIAYKEQKQYIAAVADFTQAIKINPKYILAYYIRGIIYKEQKQYNQAMADYNQAIKINPQSTLAYNNRGLIYIDMDRYPQAMADFNHAIQLNPQNAIAYSNRGLGYKKLNQYSQAKADFAKANELFRAQNQNVSDREPIEFLQQWR